MLRAAILAAMAVALGACKNAPKRVQFPPGPVRQIHIMTAPVGLNVDDRPGVDGFGVKVYASDERNPKAVPIDSGTLEILMFNGTFYGRTNVPAPVTIWKFDSAALPAHRMQSTLGAGYDFFLIWGTNRPTERLITVAARHTTGDGRIIVSEPRSVTVLEK